MKEFMEQALLLARQAAEEGEVPVGAVVVCGGKVIGRGYNRREAKKDVLSHAEIEAIRQASEAKGDWRLADCEIYVTLEPCAMCCGAILNARLGKVVFGAYDETAGAVVSRAQLFSLDLAPAPQIIGGYLAADCSALLTGFFADLRQKKDLSFQKTLDKCCQSAYNPSKPMEE